MQLTSRYRFAASHRLNTNALSPRENARLYGKCNNPHGHGHDYVLDVTVEGAPDESGQIVQRGALDALVEAEVLARVDHRDLNSDVPELAGRVTTTENLARAIEGMLKARWTLTARLARVRIAETARNAFELSIL
ncbi:MAG TPA: 6-carboxytetrahydropterin synthase [Bryobacteraceae bacterium]|nr:6-carboxytetrahydropterin synthase [Bryobacteraceae bacterium]